MACGGKEEALLDTLLRMRSYGGQENQAVSPLSLLDTPLRKRSDDDQEMKIWRSGFIIL
jgi:hypothetical protein